MFPKDVFLLYRKKTKNPLLKILTPSGPESYKKPEDKWKIRVAYRTNIFFNSNIIFSYKLSFDGNLRRIDFFY